MKLHIYLFRHGQTYFNRDHRFTGWKDSKLTSRGIRDAKKVAKKLKSKKFQVAYHSRLSRSKDTLKFVMKFHPECKEVITDDRMIERSYGKLQGKSHKQFVKREGTDSYKTLLHWHKIDHLNGAERKEFIRKTGEAELQIIRRSYNIPPPNGESVKMVEKRVNSFVKDLLKKMKKEKVNVAISAHGNSMRPFRKYFEKLTIKQMMKLENPWDDYFEYEV
ncbi:MAG: histidine phosphatase family protein [Candidatus Woesearchaeota archaeon]|jgi:2,3-bisphosphoglycerate-dependent phosphoglycerate mutase|nr:histidine phosphatase family protein [Candidatus Woesearchaeota archaeon]MDP7506590.1 histidine phosphatase family protein [Candidatus Woesearchaeota archaeon]MDP7610245.1 histidine phosphatase family protein [Candidatus Woesearchaeota archaeon]